MAAKFNIHLISPVISLHHTFYKNCKFLFQKFSIDRSTESSDSIKSYEFFDYLSDCKLLKYCRPLSSMANVLVLFQHLLSRVFRCYFHFFRCVFLSECSNGLLLKNSVQPTHRKETRHAYTTSSENFTEKSHTGQRCMCGSIMDFRTY
jgi:hypothetical protein